MWHEIVNENDINDFMKKYGHFHDSVIKEMKYISGAFVNSDLYMNPVNSELRLNIIFQRQYKNTTVIEMEFSGLNKLSLVPNNKDYTCEILEASFFTWE